MRIVVATTDVIGERMAGPAIRALHIAEALAVEHDVELVTTARCTPPTGNGFSVRQTNPAGVASLVPTTDLWVIPPGMLIGLPQIVQSDAIVVVDIYAPNHLENIEINRERPPRDRLAKVHNSTVVLNRAMQRGDAFLAASAKQRDFWLGALASVGRVNPVVCDGDPTLSTLVLVVPFGVDERPPEAGPALRGTTSGVAKDDFVLLWGGGVYDWFDPLTLIRAVDVLRRQREDIRLVFLGTGHPNPNVPKMRQATRARALTAELHLEDHVIWNEEWVPYERRGAYLLEADVGISTHFDHVETAFSFRTRMLDYLWAGLPIVSTEGDYFAEELRRTGAGITVEPDNVDALVSAIEQYFDADTRAKASLASRELGESFHWNRALAPLVAFCAAPRRAPDLLDATVQDHLKRPWATVRAPTPGPPGWRGEWALAKEYVSDGGGRLVARRIASRLFKILRGHR